MFTLLVIMLFIFISSDEEYSEQYKLEVHLENFNGKKAGLVESITDLLRDNNEIDYKKNSKDLVMKIKEKSKFHPAFLIVRFVASLKKLLQLKDGYYFSWGVGANAKGNLNDNSIALLTINPIQLNDRFNNFRNGSCSSKAFSLNGNNFKTSQFNDIRYGNYILNKVKNQIKFYHPALGSLPLGLCKNTFVKRKTRNYFEDSNFRYRKTKNNEIFKPSSNLMKIQQYIPTFRLII